MRTRRRRRVHSRHIRACQDATLPGEQLAFDIMADQVGWVQPALAAALATFPDVAADVVGDTGRITLTRPEEALPAMARTLADRGVHRWHNKAFDVRGGGGRRAGAGDVGSRHAAGLGMMSVGVHVNGLVRRGDGLHLSIGGRAQRTRHLIPTSSTTSSPAGWPPDSRRGETLVKEAAEEAAVPDRWGGRRRRSGA